MCASSVLSVRFVSDQGSDLGASCIVVTTATCLISI